MPIFRRRSADRVTERPESRIVAPAQLAQLAEIGQQFFRGQRLHVDVTSFYLPGLLAAGAPGPESEEWRSFNERLLSELIDAADADGSGWAWAGALYVAKDLDMDVTVPGYTTIIDRSVPFLVDAGCTGWIPPFAMDAYHQRPGAR